MITATEAAILRVRGTFKHLPFGAQALIAKCEKLIDRTIKQASKKGSWQDRFGNENALSIDMRPLIRVDRVKLFVAIGAICDLYGAAGFQARASRDGKACFIDIHLPK